MNMHAQVCECVLVQFMCQGMVFPMYLILDEPCKPKKKALN